MGKKVYLRCDSCKGSGDIIGMGSMKKSCNNCDGIGYINKNIGKDIGLPDENKVVNIKKGSDAERISDNDSLEIKVVKRGRGRPPKDAGIL